MSRKKWIKAVLACSAFLFVLWWALGTGATLAWFSDQDTVRNEFQIGLLDLDVSYRNDIVKEYTPLQGATKAFNDEALYEPGYTQVVYLQIENNGNVDFDYKVAVTVEDFKNGKNAWGEDIYLPNYLRYGVVFAKTETELIAMVKDRLEAKEHAPYDWGTLGTWSEPAPYSFVAGEAPHYAAMIIYMPEEVGDVANYRGIQEPRVELGIKVAAQQVGVK